MKAKLFEYDGKMSIVFLDGSSFEPIHAEIKERFIERVQSILNTTEPLELTEINLSKIRKKSTPELVKKFEKGVAGLEHEMVTKVLLDRNYIKVTKTVEPIKEKASRSKERLSLETVQAMAKEARENVGRECIFEAFGAKSMDGLFGVIKAVWIDKRVPVALYAIQLEDGSKKNKVINSEKLTLL